MHDLFPEVREFAEGIPVGPTEAREAKMTFMNRRTVSNDDANDVDGYKLVKCRCCKRPYSPLQFEE